MFSAVDRYADNFDGAALQQWLTDNADVAIGIAGVYLAFVFQGPALVERVFGPKPNIPGIKKVWVIWNLLLSIFSLYGTLVVTPALIHNFRVGGWHHTLCTFRADQFYTGRVGFAVAAFAVSKLPEFLDTVFLILSGKKNLPFLQWFHHVTTFLFAWLSYQQGSSIFICAASMNYTVHTIMYLYFALAEAGYKTLVRRVAMAITFMQLAQMVAGVVLTTYVLLRMYVHEDSTCTGTTPPTVRGQTVVYLFNLYLFGEMFVRAYILPRPAKPKQQ